MTGKPPVRRPKSLSMPQKATTKRGCTPNLAPTSSRRARFSRSNRRPFSTRAAGTTRSMYWRKVRVNSGCLRSSSTTRGKSFRAPSADLRVEGRMPWAAASLCNSSTHFWKGSVPPAAGWTTTRNTATTPKRRCQGRMRDSIIEGCSFAGVLRLFCHRAGAPAIVNRRDRETGCPTFRSANRRRGPSTRAANASCSPGRGRG